MAAQAIMAGLNIATSAIPLFFGENNIFSGKARQASKQLEKNFQRSQQMGLPSEVNQYLQNRLSRSNMGLPSASLGLYQQQSARNLTSNLGGLKSRRSALAGIGDLAQAGQDAALKLAAMEGEAMMSNREMANQALMQVGGMKYNEELRKQQEAADYWGTRKAESNAAISSSLSALGNAIGSSVSSGAFEDIGKGEKSDAAKLRGLRRSFRQAGMQRSN